MNKKENDSGVAIDSTPLLACPWCGELPAMMKAEQQGDCPLPVIVWQVCCNNPDCALNPTTGFHDDEQEAIESWQTRIDANPTGLRSPRFGGDKQDPVVGTINQEDGK